MKLKADGAEIFYERRGRGPNVVLLHPFPSCHEFWLPTVGRLENGFRFTMLDLRGMGQSQPVDGVATMAQHADDLRRVLDAEGIGRAVFVGCSIGGYVLFEFWRQHRERVAALVLADTRSTPDTPQEREQRLKNSEAALERGPEFVIDSMVPKLLGETTLRTRLDVVAAARATMGGSTAQGLASVLRGMAERVDSTDTLANINVPTMVVGGDQDIASPRPELERIAQGIAGAELRIIRNAGHYAPFEQAAEFAEVLRPFFDRHARQ